MQTTMEARARILIGGRVQGIFFRQFTKVNADKLGLMGWVRNNEDGQVEVVVEGKKDKIDELIKLLKKGPLLSSVSQIDISWEKPTGEFLNFKII